MAGNSSLNAAARAKKDEFYTQLPDIEQELRHYRRHFRGKTVFCNCDDPFESNFFKYFVLNFNKLGLKKVIATCYRGSPIAGQQLSMFDEVTETEQPANKPYKAVVTKVYDATGDGGISMLDVAELFKSGENELTLLEGDGDFRSPECLELLDEADIVCTNPPFSLFREFVATLVSYKKQFLIIGNKNASHYKEIFPLIKNNKMWVGVRNMNTDFWLVVPDDQPCEKIVDSVRLKHIMACWFTNLDIKKHHEELILVRHYSPERYPRYYNYDGIDVDSVAEIPCDYAGHMGVPDTFLDSFNPEQFELIGIGTDVPKTLEHISYKNQNRITYEKNGVVIWETEYTVPERKAGNSLRIEENGQPGKLPYSRIIIRNRHPEEPKS